MNYSMIELTHTEFSGIMGSIINIVPAASGTDYYNDVTVDHSTANYDTALFDIYHQNASVLQNINIGMFHSDITDNVGTIITFDTSKCNLIHLKFCMMPILRNLRKINFALRNLQNVRISKNKNDTHGVNITIIETHTFNSNIILIVL